MKKIVISITLILTSLFTLVGCKGKMTKDEYYNVLENYVNLETESMGYAEYIEEATLEGKTTELYIVYHQHDGIKYTLSEMKKEVVDDKEVEKKVIIEEFLYIPIYEAESGDILGVKRVDRINSNTELPVEEQYKQRLVDIEEYYNVIAEYKGHFYEPYKIPASPESIIEAGSTKNTKSYIITYKLDTAIYTVTLSKMEKLSETFGKTYRVGKLLVEDESKGLRVNYRFALPNMGITAKRIEDPLKNFEIIPGEQPNPLKEVKELIDGLVLENVFAEDGALVQYTGCEWLVVDGEEYVEIKDGKLLVHTEPAENTVVKIAIQVSLFPEIRKEFGIEVLAPKHEHVFVEGKCECGEVDPEYVAPEVHEHTACPTCGLCTAEDCDGEAAVKCQGHEPEPVLTVKERVEAVLETLVMPEFVAGEEWEVADLTKFDLSALEDLEFEVSYGVLIQGEGMEAVRDYVKLDGANKTLMVKPYTEDFSIKFTINLRFDGDGGPDVYYKEFIHTVETKEVVEDTELIKFDIVYISLNGEYEETILVFNKEENYAWMKTSNTEDDFEAKLSFEIQEDGTIKLEDASKPYLYFVLLNNEDITFSFVFVE